MVVGFVDGQVAAFEVDLPQRLALNTMVVLPVWRGWPEQGDEPVGQNLGYEPVMNRAW